MPEHTTDSREDAPAPVLPVTLDMQGKVADFLRATEMGDAELAAQGPPRVREPRQCPSGCYSLTMINLSANHGSIDPTDANCMGCE